MGEPLRVLIAVDAAPLRRVVANALARIPDAELVAVASDGEQALRRIAQGGVQLAILDIALTTQRGLSAAREIAKLHPEVQLAILSGVANARHTLEALASGALEVIPKPGAGEARDRLRSALARVVEAACAARATEERRRATSRVPEAGAPDAEAPRGALELVLVGVSTGGPKALLELIPRLPADLACPVLVVQHMSAGFTASLAESLARVSELPVFEAADGEAILSGRVLIAPGGVHMELAPGERGAAPTVRLTRAPFVNGCRPSVDVLWSSVAENFRGPVLGVVLTGMGRDGCEGMRALRAHGAYCLAQDEATSVVWGMPGAVATAGLADEVLPLEAIAARVTALASQRQRGRAA